MAQKVYVLILGLSGTLEQCAEAISPIEMVLSRDDAAEVWGFGSRQAIIIFTSRVRPERLFAFHLVDLLRHEIIETSVIVDGEHLALPKDPAGLPGRIAERLREVAKRNQSEPSLPPRVPTSRSSRKAP